MRVAIRMAVLMTGLVMLGATSLCASAPGPVGGSGPPIPSVAAR